MQRISAVIIGGIHFLKGLFSSVKDQVAFPDTSKVGRTTGSFPRKPSEQTLQLICDLSGSSIELNLVSFESIIVFRGSR